MHRWSLLARLGLLGIALGAGANAAAQATLVADAHVNAALPAVNSGGISNVNVGNGYTGLLQFNLSLLPAGTTAAQISRAVLVVYVNRLDTPGALAVQPVTSAWSEGTVTYATIPGMGTAAQTAQVSAAGAYVAMDVTGLVQGWVAAPATNFGVGLTTANAVLAIDSKENDLTGHPPQLEVALSSASAVGPAGPSGPAGPQGATGATGATGPAGPAGAAGATGPAGPAGPSGPLGQAGADGGGGFLYEGAYQATRSYGVGDVVLWEGGSWTSLQSGNFGNQPDLSPLYWGVLTSAGPAGAAGPAGTAGAPGAPGAAGLPGPPGAAGAAGAQGPAGPQGLMGVDGSGGPPGLTGETGPPGPSGAPGAPGAPGPVGLTFIGMYDSTVNYALADGVSYQGAGYVSLISGNHGNTPDQSPQAWALFAAAGANGLTGATGATGPQGFAGPTGTTGATGAIGPVGPQGEQGPPVVNYRGNYISSANYEVADAVSYGGSTYVALAGFNVGNTPDQSPAAWAVLAAQGPRGSAGPTGAVGPQGPAGAAGATGAAGPAGPPVTFDGEWLAGTAYAVGDAVSYGGSAYSALVSNTGREPDVSAGYWGLLAAAGANGLTGATGAIGPQGPTGGAGPAGADGATGPAGPIGPAGVNWRGGYSGNATYGTGDAVSFGGASYLSTTTGNTSNEPDTSPSQWGLLAAAGAVGATGPIGPQGSAGQAGPAGAAGAVGPPGPAGVSFLGAWSTGVNYVSGDAVTFAGSTYLATAPNVAVEPDQNASVWTVLAAAGSAGPSGAAGQAATVQVGSVTTGAPGSNALVVNAGTGAAAVLNFTIPQGAAGAAGTGGSSSSLSSALGSMVHQVSYAAVYYAVNNPSQSASEESSVLTWVPNGCTATQLQVFSQQGSTITVTLRAGTPGAMADTSLSCQVATGTSCATTGSVSVPAGGFVDLSVAHADSIAQGVWTALSCQ